LRKDEYVVAALIVVLVALYVYRHIRRSSSGPNAEA
jgi:hypothetical protein